MENLRPIERAYLEAIGYARISPEQCIAKLQALVDLYQNSAAMTGPTGECLTLAHRRLDQLKQEIEKRSPSNSKSSKSGWTTPMACYRPIPNTPKPCIAPSWNSTPTNPGPPTPSTAPNCT